VGIKVLDYNNFAVDITVINSGWLAVSV